jgi:hypothetical protein
MRAGGLCRQFHTGDGCFASFIWFLLVGDDFDLSHAMIASDLIL